MAPDSVVTVSLGQELDSAATVNTIESDLHALVSGSVEPLSLGQNIMSSAPVNEFDTDLLEMMPI